jgi:hypothetical protein
MNDTPSKKIFTLNSETLVPIGLIATVVGSAVAVSFWLNSSLLDLRYNQRDTNSRIEQLAAQIADLKDQGARTNNDRWSRLDMIRWVELANAKNPTAALPLPGN